MRKIILAAIAALAVTACTSEQSAPQPQPTSTHTPDNVDECPRADGQPCK